MSNRISSVINRLINQLLKLRDKYFSEGRRVSPQALNHLRESLLEESSLERDYLLLILGSCAIATFGLLSNSAAVIIGAMLIAPLMLPIRGVAFGILEADKDLIQSGMKALGIGTVVAIVIAALIGGITGLPQYGSEVFSRTKPNLLDLGIAITAGALCGIAKVEPKISHTVAGTAIAVALMPPVCVVGLWLAEFHWQHALGAMLLYMTNLFGITLACMMAFMLAGYSPFHRARRPIQLTLVLTSLLLIPLGYSTLELVRQARLEASLRTALLDRTITFQRLALVDMRTDWLSTPPEVSLVVYAQDPVTPKQVGLLEAFVAREMGRPFRLMFEVSRVEAVTSDPKTDISEPRSTPKPQDSNQDPKPTQWRPEPTQ